MTICPGIAQDDRTATEHAGMPGNLCWRGGGGAGADDAGHHPIYVNRGRFRRLCQAVRSI